MLIVRRDRSYIWLLSAKPCAVTTTEMKRRLTTRCTWSRAAGGAGERQGILPLKLRRFPAPHRMPAYSCGF
jgi:hypothetical protein